MEENKEVPKKKQLRNALKFELQSSDKEPGGGLSITVPDESLSVRQLIERFTRGQSSGVGVREGYFDEGSDFDSPDMQKLDHMDLIDRDEFAAANAATKERLEKEIADDKKRKKEEADRLAEEDREIREKFRKEKKSGQEPTSDEKPKG